MAFPEYANLAFPHQTTSVGGTLETLVLTVTANDGAPVTNPVTPAADWAAYQAGDATVKAKHKRFSDIVMYFRAYGMPVSVAATGTTITLTYEHSALHTDGAIGRPSWVTAGHRPNAYELAQAYLAADTHSVTAISVTVNGAAQTS